MSSLSFLSPRGLNRSWLAAHKVGSVINTSDAAISCNERIRAKRTGADRFAPDETRADDAVWWSALLDPLDQWRHRIKAAHSGTSVAVKHSRYHKEAKETVSGRSHLLNDLLVLLDTHARI